MLLFSQSIRLVLADMAQKRVPLANLGRRVNLVGGSGSIEVKKIFQFIFTLLCILQTKSKISVISLRNTWLLQGMSRGNNS